MISANMYKLIIKKEQSMTNKRKGQLARWTSLMAFLFAIGTVGGMELFLIEPGRGIAYIAITLAIAGFAGRKGGIFR